MFSETYDDVAQLHDELTRRILYGQPDVISGGVAPWVTDVMVRADSMYYPGFDLKRVWISKTWWNSLVRKYIDREPTLKWLDAIGEMGAKKKRKGILHLRGKEAVIHARGEGARIPPGRQWGACMLGWTWRLEPAPQLTMISRTSYVGYLAQLDLAVSCHLGDLAAEAMGMAPEEVSFVWQLGVAQLHPFKTLPWFYQRGREQDRDRLEKKMSLDKMRRDTPSLWVVRRELERIWKEDAANKGYGEHHYAQRLRMRQRYHAEVTGTGEDFAHGEGGRVQMKRVRAIDVLPHVWYDELNLGAALR